MEQSLKKFMIKLGYTIIPLKKSKVGHFLVDIVFAGYSLTAAIDSGASNTIFDIAWCKANGIEIKKLTETGGGVGSSTASIYEMQTNRITIENVLTLDSVFYSMDLSHVNESLEIRDEKAVQAIIGADILFPHSAVLDYANSVLYLKKNQDNNNFSTSASESTN